MQRPKFCPECGTAIPESAKFCPGCGNLLSPPASVPPIPFSAVKAPEPITSTPPLKSTEEMNPAPDFELQQEVTRMNTLPPAQALARIQELQRTNPALLQRMMPTAQTLASELERTNPAMIQQVKSLMGL